ncbi:MAG: sugar-transfer associated ATP-grasp domain-containing protein [Psychroflexus halocasei]
MKEKVKRFLYRIKKISKETGKNYLSIISDYSFLRKKLNISFYEYYCFYLDKNEDLRETFLGYKNKKIFLSLINPRKYYILARNKYLSHVFFKSTSIKTSELYFYYNPLNLSTDSVCTNEFEVSEKIKSLGIREFVIKTTESSQGEGVIVIKDIKEVEDKMILIQSNDKEILLSKILNHEALIFEKLLYQTKQFSSFNASSINTIRFMTSLDPSGEVNIFGTFIKVGRKGAWVDNAGSGGNICANVDIKTGLINNVIEFNDWRSNRDITHHTDSGTLLEGVKIKDWENICEQVKTYQKQIPYLKAIGWDVAITDEGPVIIEINDFWDATGQLFIGKGWLIEIENLYKKWKYEY